MVLAAYIAAFVTLPVLLWLSSVGNVTEYLHEGVPDGQLLYILSKLAGLIAISLLTLQISLMSLRRLPENTVFSFRIRPSWTLSHHAVLGTGVIVCATLHAALFFLAASARSEHLTWPLFQARFQNGFYDSMVSLGALGLYTAILLGTLGWLARRRPAYRTAHRIVVFVCTALVIIHSYAIGSETHTLALKFYYAALLGILAVSGISFLRGRLRLDHA